EVLPCAGALAVEGLGGFEAEPRSILPGRALVAMGGDATLALQHPRQVHHVPRREGHVSIREVVLWTARPGIEVGRTRPGVADPSRIRCRGDHVTDVLERVEDIHGAVLDAVLVAGDDAPRHLPVE